MANLYANEEWAAFREKVIQLDSESCVTCGRTRSDGVVLQVHHKRYICGKKPWEYDPADCETLCKGCHAREHGEIRPSTGWEYVGEDDLEDLIGTCELCGSAIRYVHHVQHQHWEPMGVGTVCCDNLTGTQEATEARRILGRLKRFVCSDKWVVGAEGYSINHKGFNVLASMEAGDYKLVVDGVLGVRRYKTLVEAKESAFNFIDSGKAAVFFHKD